MEISHDSFSPVRPGVILAILAMLMVLDPADPLQGCNENLLAVHDAVERLFFAAISLSQTGGLPPTQQALLEVALGIEDLVGLARNERFSKLRPRIAALVPILRQVREGFPGIAALPAATLVDLGNALEKATISQGFEEDKVLLGITLLKDDFSVFLRLLATHLASRPEAR